MAHGPSLGSRLAALRNPGRYRPICRVDGHAWPCPAATEAGRWSGDGPVPDGDRYPPDPPEQVPADFILNGKRLFPINRNFGKPQ
ncbi:hypothetical protein GCM10009557_66520 [Virgisporangium ochraceum]|uniref:Uncharacterized protein n=1 Tax=Virgisporangium ochraceum TaxID=65505 RepID=A0A8J3ZQ48_9ACTN|nr:hypothetical protein [Virgisporangium ochraceum]GIJ66225.1 hypothetical protein Voc01_011420 [Virgisporangium ochraceum]